MKDILKNFLASCISDPPYNKEKFNFHITIKPKELIKNLIEISVFNSENNIVLNPFFS